MAQEVERDVATLIETGRIELYPYPAVALKLSQVIHAKGTSVAGVARIVSADAALVGSVLRLANSPSFGGGGQVTDLREAVGRVGFEALERFVMAAGLAQHACMAGPLQDLRFLVWRWSVTNALICQGLAKRRNLDHGLGFLAGLLHSFGKTVALSAIEQVLRTKPRRIVLPADQWLSLLRAHHQELGIAIARQWGLPPLIRAGLRDPNVVNDRPDQQALLALPELAEAVVSLAERKARAYRTRSMPCSMLPPWRRHNLPRFHVGRSRPPRSTRAEGARKRPQPRHGS